MLGSRIFQSNLKTTGVGGVGDISNYWEIQTQTGEAAGRGLGGLPGDEKGKGAVP